MLSTLAHKSFNDVDTIRGAWPPPNTRPSRFFGLCEHDCVVKTKICLLIALR